MKTLKALLFSLFVLATVSCDNDDDATNNVCDETHLSLANSTVFSAANGYTLYETMDLETHEYTMTINSSGKICSVGYQNPTTYSGTYEMKVVNNTTSQSTTQTFSFSQTALQYQDLAMPIIVNTGDEVVVSRTITAGYPSLNSTLGNIYTKSNPISFPVMVNLYATITSTNFYGAGGPVPNYGIPLIGLGFIVN
jgi:hypothetical protein